MALMVFQKQVACLLNLLEQFQALSFSADEQGSQLTQEHLAGTFTTDIITATLTGTSETTDQNGIVVTRTSSPTSEPTTNPTSSPITTGQPLASRFYGNIGSVKGSAYPKTANGNTPLSSGQIPTGTELVTGDNGIIAFNPPNQGGTVYLGANSDAGWVSLTSQPAPDNQISYLVYPKVSSGIIFPNGYDEFKDMLISMPIDATIAVAVFGEAILPAAAVALVVEGGAFLIPNGVAYIKETVSHLIVVPQGALAGENTEYVVTVSNTGTVVQVINGPVVFIDPITNNTVTIQTNQGLTLPTGPQSGFSEQELQNDVTTVNPTSVDHWWSQTTASSNGISTQPVLLVALALIIAVAITFPAVIISKHRKKEQTQTGEFGKKLKRSSRFSTPPPPPNVEKETNNKMSAENTLKSTTELPKVKFCSNCGKQLPIAKNFCPFCGFALETTENKSEN